MAFLSTLGYSVVPLGKLAASDFILSKAGKSYLVEYKRRHNNYAKYDTVIMPEQKMRKCLTLSEELGLPFLYVVQFDDGMYGAKVEDYHTTMGGRTDRNDPLDIHRVAHVHKKYSKRIA